MSTLNVNCNRNRTQTHKQTTWDTHIHTYCVQKRNKIHDENHTNNNLLQHVTHRRITYIYRRNHNKNPFCRISACFHDLRLFTTKKNRKTTSSFKSSRKDTQCWIQKIVKQKSFFGLSDGFSEWAIIIFISFSTHSLSINFFSAYAVIFCFCWLNMFSIRFMLHRNLAYYSKSYKVVRNIIGITLIF